MTSPNAEYSTMGLTQRLPPPKTHRLQEPELENVESVYMYRPGGHHPVNLGDVIGEKFKIIHKLGHGGFAIVWMARDLVRHITVALKILKADAPNDEIKILKRLNDSPRDGRIISLHETFTIHGPNGVHHCLVLDVGGPSLKELSFSGKRPPLPVLKRAAKNLAEGVAALHSAGVCHGDLTDTNVLFQIKNLSYWTEEQIYCYLGRPKTEPLVDHDGNSLPGFAPAHVVDALDYSQLDMEYLSGSVLIADLGGAFFADSVPADLGVPASFYAPELLFGYRPSYAVDLWALGCLIFEMHTFRLLIFAAFGGLDEALAVAIETVGALPDEWQNYYWNKEVLFEPEPGEEKHRWFDDRIARIYALDSRVRKEMSGLSQDEHVAFLDLLKRILVFQPTHRLSAAEVANHPWFLDS